MITTTTKRLPSLIYGTAWKKSHTQDLVKEAIKVGFRAIDTAAQPKHYDEALVGSGIREAINDGITTRDELWIQTKFTQISGQDASSVPYHVDASIEEQVNRSIERSLHNLRVDNHKPYLDALLLHSPFENADDTYTAWQAMSKHVPERIGVLGVSNVDKDQLQQLFEKVKVKPAIIQNRFHAETGYDQQLRAYCKEVNITYQSFWTLTANPHLLSGHTVQSLAKETGITAETALYALVALGLNIKVLNGTTNKDRMKQDLEAMDTVRAWREGHRDVWMRLVSSFKGSLSRGRIL